MAFAPESTESLVVVFCKVPHNSSIVVVICAETLNFRNLGESVTGTLKDH